MARPRSDEKRRAILAAATRVIFAQGLSAPTAGVAKEAGVANGTLFTYFETKSVLINQLYLELKSEMASAAMKEVSADLQLHEQFYRIWQNWTQWAVASPEKRRVLAQLSLSTEITAESHVAGYKMLAGLTEIVERSRENGPLRKAPAAFVFGLMNSMAETTMDFMMRDTANAMRHCKSGFEAVGG